MKFMLDTNMLIYLIGTSRRPLLTVSVRWVTTIWSACRS